MALVALLPACGFKSAATPDGGADAPPDAPQCFGRYLPVCFTTGADVPGTAVMLADQVDIDTDATDAGSYCHPHNNQAGSYCVVAGAGLTLKSGAKLTAHGARPLILLSTSTIELLGDIDVSSHHVGPQPRGAGANPAGTGACSFTTAPGAAITGGGAYGGSLGSKGGDGSDASGALTGKGTAGAAMTGFPLALRGGCAGGDGAVVVGLAGRGGDGGGAIAIVAEMQILVDSKINASGGGGHGGASTATSGGGGGGSGGMIVFDARVGLLFGGRVKLWANGGSGAQGGLIGSPGDDGGESTGPMQAAPGTNGAGAGGNGGNGSLGASGGTNGAADASGTGGGGGGGGGAGFIHAPGLTDPAVISPPSQDLPAGPA